MPKYNAGQIKVLEGIVESFIKNVVKSAGNASDGATPAEVFSDSVRVMEMPKIIAARIAFNRGAADPDKRVKQILKYCSSVLPAMQRSFGDDLLIDALPADARTQEIANICRENGATGIAALVDEAVKRDAAADMQNQPKKQGGQRRR